MPNKYTQNRRRKLIVNKSAQGKLILGTALAPAIALAILAVVTALYCARIMDEAALWDEDVPNLMPLFYFVVVFELVAGIALLRHSVRMSHRVTGPAYRICRSLERIRGGDISFAVKFRDGDHLTDIGCELNKLLDWLNDHPPPGALTRAAAAAERRAATGVAEGPIPPAPALQETVTGS